MSLITEPREIKSLPEGVHRGKIINVDKRTTEKYEYIEFEIETDEKQFVKHSIPNNTSFDALGNPKSQLAVLLKAIGFDITQPIDLTNTIGKRIQFQTKNKVVGNASYPRVINDTILPIAD